MVIVDKTKNVTLYCTYTLSDVPFLSVYFVLTSFFKEQLHLLNKVPLTLFKIDLYSGNVRFVLGYNCSVFSD